MKTVTIESTGRAVIALDSKDGACVAFRKKYCNPAALAQLISEVENDGYTIDWDNSTVAKPVERPAHYVNQLTEMGVTRPLSRAIRCF
jgi:hypothetical protein